MLPSLSTGAWRHSGEPYLKESDYLTSYWKWCVAKTAMKVGVHQCEAVSYLARTWEWFLCQIFIYRRVKLLLVLKCPLDLDVICCFSDFSSIFVLWSRDLLEGSATVKKPVRFSVTPTFCALEDDYISSIFELLSSFKSNVGISFLMVADFIF